MTMAAKQSSGGLLLTLSLLRASHAGHGRRRRCPVPKHQNQFTTLHRTLAHLTGSTREHPHKGTGTHSNKGTDAHSAQRHRHAQAQRHRRDQVQTQRCAPSTKVQARRNTMALTQNTQRH